MCEDADVHARLIYSEVYLCSLLDVIFLGGQTFILTK